MARSRDWFEHALKRTGWQPERQVVTLATLGLVIALIFGALYLSQVANEATTNRRLSELVAERDELERTNEQLRAEIANLEAVPRLLARAQELGFAPASSQNIEYLYVERYNPARINTVAPIASQPETTAEYDETFTGWLRQQWDRLRHTLSDLVGGGN